MKNNNDNQDKAKKELIACLLYHNLSFSSCRDLLLEIEKEHERQTIIQSSVDLLIAKYKKEFAEAWKNHVPPIPYDVGNKVKVIKTGKTGTIESCSVSPQNNNYTVYSVLYSKIEDYQIYGCIYKIYGASFYHGEVELISDKEESK